MQNNLLLVINPLNKIESAIFVSVTHSLLPKDLAVQNLKELIQGTPSCN